MGILYIGGGFFNDHRDEVISLMNNEVKRGLVHNPLDRIIATIDESDGLRIETTSENLAVHLGKVLYHAYGGEINYRFSDEQKMARIFWNRESKEVKK
jgi:NMD protein affecting ribosome stability and mRNA decay